MQSGFARWVSAAMCGPPAQRAEGRKAPRGAAFRGPPLATTTTTTASVLTPSLRNTLSSAARRGCWRRGRLRTAAAGAGAGVCAWCMGLCRVHDLMCSESCATDPWQYAAGSLCSPQDRVSRELQSLLPYKMHVKRLTAWAAHLGAQWPAYVECSLSRTRYFPKPSVSCAQLRDCQPDRSITPSRSSFPPSQDSACPYSGPSSRLAA